MTQTLSASEAPPAPIIAGRYRIEHRLGRGGMGSVWLAEHLTLHSPVAVKVIDRALASSDEARARFLREARSAAMLRSPHVVQVLDHGIDMGVPYLVMELLEGESLAARIERLGKLTPEQTARIMTHVSRAMTRAHAANIVHRDLKPENVFLVRNEDEEIAKVLDFGIAKAAPALAEVHTGTRTGTVMGTPHYMSPEQIEGSKQVDHRTDLWAMAVIAFECLTGKRPFDGPTLGGVLVQICAKPIPVPSAFAATPPAFDTWFLRATTRDPEGRYQSAKELADELRAALEDQPAATAAKRAPVGPSQPEPKQEHQAQAQRVPQLSHPEQPAIRMSLSLPPAASLPPAVRRTPWRRISAAAGLGVAGLGYWLLSPASISVQERTPTMKSAERMVVEQLAPSAHASVITAVEPPAQAAVPAQAPAVAAPTAEQVATQAVAVAERPSAAERASLAVPESPARLQAKERSATAEPRSRAAAARAAKAADKARERTAAKPFAPPPEPTASQPAAADKPDLGF